MREWHEDGRFYFETKGSGTNMYVKVTKGGMQSTDWVRLIGGSLDATVRFLIRERFPDPKPPEAKEPTGADEVETQPVADAPTDQSSKKDRAS